MTTGITSALAIELVASCGRLALPGGLVLDVPNFGPPLSIADAAPEARRLFVAAAQAIVGFDLMALRRHAGGPCPEPEVYVPMAAVSGAPIRLRCGTIGQRAVVAVVDNDTTISVFLADLPSGRAPKALHLHGPGLPTGGIAFACQGLSGGFLYVGNADGQLIRWQLAISSNGASLVEVDSPIVVEAKREREFGALVVDLDVQDGRALLAALDGHLELWLGAQSSSAHPRNSALSAPTARIDCSESPALWGARWVPLHQIVQKSQFSFGNGVESDQDRVQRRGLGIGLNSKASVVEAFMSWSALPAEIVRERVLPFISLSDLACHLAVVNRAHKAAVESELADGARKEHLAFCFSDCTAWLLNSSLSQVLARQDLPFCAGHSSATALPALATMLVAPKTDLIASPGVGIAVMPHVWALECSIAAGLRKPGLSARRLDLLEAETAFPAAVSIPPRYTGGDEQNATQTDAPQIAVPRESAHTLGVAVLQHPCDSQNKNRLEMWTLLATGELLLHNLTYCSPASLIHQTHFDSLKTLKCVPSETLMKLASAFLTRVGGVT